MIRRIKQTMMCKHVKKKVLVDFSDLPTDHL